MLVATLALVLAATAAPPAPPAAVTGSTTDLSTAHRLVTLADYLASDYPGAVAGGRVINQLEYEEQLSLAADAVGLARTLGTPAGSTAGEPSLAARFEAIRADIAGLQDAGRVAAGCRAARQTLVAGFRLPTFPREPPDPARGIALYRKACSPCHGEDGHADTDLARKYQPPPRRFDDPEVLAGLSPYRVFNTASFGVTGTAMPAFGETLTPAERWDVAFHVLSLRHRREPARAGEDAFHAARLPGSIAALAVATDGDLLGAAGRAGAGGEAALAALAFARTVAPYEAPPEPLVLARTLLGRSLEAARAGRGGEASRHALDAYLEGVEPAEGVLRPADPGLTARIESGFVAFREKLRSGAPIAEVEAAATALDGWLREARESVAGKARSPWYVFFAGLAILLREGLEAALIVAAILAVLRRLAPGERRLARRVHLGWLLALVAGGLTWVGARSLLPIGAGQREAAEGVVSLLAAALLFWASYWLLANLEVRRWMEFLRRQVEGSLRPGRGLSLFAIAFLAVYREMFESVLFFEALVLGAAGAEVYVVAGAAAGAVLLGAVVWVLFRLGARLPLKPFFAVSSCLLGILSFVLAGDGVYALQQAGYLPAPALSLPALPSLGIHPTIPGVAVQATILLLFALAAFYSLVLAPGRGRSKGSAAAIEGR